jgi:hypothetical protein
MAEKNAPKSANPVVVALNSVYGTLAKKSDALPAPLAIGLPILVTILLIAVLKDSLPTNIAWLVGLAFVIPMAGYIAQLVLARSAPKPDTEAKAGPVAQPWAKIESPNPKPGEFVEREIDCRGSATGIPPNMHLWLAVEEDRAGRKLIWPKEGEVFVNEQGKWKHQIYEDGVAQEVSVSLLLAEPLGDDFIRRWLDAGKLTQNYSELMAILGTTRLARVSGIRLRPKETKPKDAPGRK